MRESLKVLPSGAIVLPGDKYRYRIAELEGLEAECEELKQKEFECRHQQSLNEGET